MEQEIKQIDVGVVGESKLNNHTKKRFYFIPRFGCIRSDDEFPVIEKPDVGRSLNVEARCDEEDHAPKHLIVMVNGIIGSAQNWRYAAKQFVKAYPSDVIVHCSRSNSSLLTLDGIDVMGKRLADEVILVVDGHPKLEKISFVGHSLGGLVARYAIAVLYRQDFTTKDVENGECEQNELNKSSVEKTRSTIAGLEPVNFISVATPHLGSRGHKQIPVLCGFGPMEKVAMHGSRIFRRTGKQLFLRDKDNMKPPLLLQMCCDSDDLKFMSALQLFKRRVAYANAASDQIVGWSTSSLRRVSDLPKRRNLIKNDRYRYIFSEEMQEVANGPDTKVTTTSKTESEETMLRELTKLRWERVDVNFRGSLQRFFAHNTIQVKTYCINSDGAHVIRHMIDNIQL